MKTLLKMYVYVMYIVALPFFLVFSTVVFIWDMINDLKCGKLDIKGAIKAYAEGCIIGHRINMETIEHLYDDEFHEEGV